MRPSQLSFRHRAVSVTVEPSQGSLEAGGAGVGAFSRRSAGLGSACGFASLCISFPVRGSPQRTANCFWAPSHSFGLYF